MIASSRADRNLNLPLFYFIVCRLTNTQNDQWTTKIGPEFDHNRGSLERLLEASMGLSSSVAWFQLTSKFGSAETLPCHRYLGRIAPSLFFAMAA